MTAKYATARLPEIHQSFWPSFVSLAKESNLTVTSPGFLASSLPRPDRALTMAAAAPSVPDLHVEPLPDGSVSICGEPTRFACAAFSNRVFFTISQLPSFGSIVSLEARHPAFCYTEIAHAYGELEPAPLAAVPTRRF
jgi:hypothetical protein